MFKEHGSRRRIPVLLILIVLIVIGLSCFTVVSPRFRITSVTIDGTVKVDRNSIEQFVNRRLDTTFFGVAWRRVYYLTPTKALSSELQHSIERLISLNSCTIERRNYHTLVVTISERTPNLIWETTTGMKYFIDEKGIIVERVSSDVPSTFKTIVDVNGLAADVGARVKQPGYLTALYDIERTMSGLPVHPVSYKTWEVKCRTISQETNKQNTNNNEQPNEDTALENNSEPVLVNASASECDRDALIVNDPTLVVETNEGWNILFDTSTGIEAQVRKLQLALQQTLKNKRENLQYVDVRYGDKIYYE